MVSPFRALSFLVPIAAACGSTATNGPGKADPDGGDTNGAHDGGTTDSGAHGGGGTKQAGQSCAAADECASGECLDLAMVTNTGCSSAGKACSKTCHADGDCTSLGTKFKCFGGCGTTKFCGATL